MLKKESCPYFIIRRNKIDRYYIWAIAHRSIPQADRRNKGYLDLSFIR